MPTETELVAEAVTYLKSAYNEDTVSMLITDNSVSDGNGTMTVECTVRTGFLTSDWRKTFTFENGNVAGMSWLPRTKLLRKWHRRNAREPQAK